MGIVNTDEGELRIIFSDASETNKRVIQQYSSEQLDVSTDPRQLQIVPKSVDLLMEDDKMILEYSAMAATNIDYTAAEAWTKIRIPVTVRNKRTGTIFEKTLRHPDFASADVTISGANTFTVIGTYTVGAQEEVKLGWSIAENSRIYALFGETTSS